MVKSGILHYSAFFFERSLSSFYFMYMLFWRVDMKIDWFKMIVKGVNVELVVTMNVCDIKTSFVIQVNNCLYPFESDIGRTTCTGLNG